MNLSFVPLSITGSDSVIKWLVNPHLPALINLHGFFLKKYLFEKQSNVRETEERIFQSLVYSLLGNDGWD